MKNIIKRISVLIMIFSLAVSQNTISFASSYESTIYNDENFEDIGEINTYGEIENTLTLSETENYLAYFTNADSIYYVGGTNAEGYSSNTTAIYTNTNPSDSNYFLYSNAVILNNNTKYDLVIYPFKKETNAGVDVSLIPILRAVGVGAAGYKLFITEHGNINNRLNMNILFGISDLDNGEFIMLPSSSEILHRGSKVAIQNSNISGYTKYCGLSNSGTIDEIYNKNCVISYLNITTNGLTIYYGHNSASRYGAELSLDEMLPYINVPYTVNHYTMDLKGNGHDEGGLQELNKTPTSGYYSLRDTETFTELVGLEVTPSTKNYEGFTAPPLQTKTVLADGSLVINYFYTRNKYPVTFIDRLVDTTDTVPNDDPHPATVTKQLFYETKVKAGTQGNKLDCYPTCNEYYFWGRGNRTNMHAYHMFMVYVGETEV